MYQNVEVKVLSNFFSKKYLLPKKVTSGSAGLDLRACLNEELIIKPNETTLVGSGIALNIKCDKCAAIILPRSGIAHKYGIILSNSVGLIDSDYQGEIMIPIWNRSKLNFLMKPGDRIAQLLFINLQHVKFMFVNSFSHKTDRGSKGFGHSGVN